MSEFTFLTIHFNKDIGESTPRVATVKVNTAEVGSIQSSFVDHDTLVIRAFNGEVLLVSRFIVDMIRVTPGDLVVEKPAEVPPIWTPAEIADAEAA